MVWLALGRLKANKCKDSNYKDNEKRDLINNDLMLKDGASLASPEASEENMLLLSTNTSEGLK